MFDDLDKTLKKILDDPAMPASIAGLHNADKSFLTPDRNFTPAQAAVNLFLYEVKENRQLRDAEPIVEKIGTTFVQRPPPLRVDCCYLVTGWSSQTGAVKASEEHRLLAEALLWLSRFPTIPATFLQGSLTNQLYSPPTMVAQADGSKNAAEFWLALGIPPRPAFHLTVTIAMELLLQVEGPLVTTTVTEYLRANQTGNGDVWVQIGGNILTGAPPRPISGGSATVNAIAASGTKVKVDNSAPFRVGDFVTKDSVNHANINLIQGDNMTLSVALAGLEVGDILRSSQPAQAWVSIEDAAGMQLQTTTTDSEGRFMFTKLQPGNCTLRARAEGFAEVTRQIEVPSTTGGYDIQLT
jgi:hypothetical protein